MKIALFIFPFGPSHGNILQTFALKSALEQEGHKVDIIQRLRPRPTLLYCIRRGIYYIRLFLSKHTYTTFFFRGIYPPMVIKPFDDFVNANMGDNLKNVSSQGELIALGKVKYDAFVVGSDQSWRQEYVPRIENYFLDFVDESTGALRISYAASFGKDTWTYTDEQTTNCCRLSKLFNSISVREKTGIDLCAKHLKVSATQVLDPTLLYDKSFYVSLIDNSFDVPNNACCHYLLDYNEKKMQIVEKVCASLNLEPFAVNKKTEDNGAPIKDRIPRTINQWLAGFYKAKYVVVDSFHALVFSLLFNKEFVVIGNKQRGLDRFKSLLNIVDLSERMIYEVTDLTDDMINKGINWNIVNCKLEIERKKSRSFLIDALNG